MPSLQNMANGGSGWSLNFHLLEVTRATAASTVERTEQTKHLSVSRIHYSDTQRPLGATAQTGTEAALLCGLTQGLSSPRAQLIVITYLPA